MGWEWRCFVPLPTPLTLPDTAAAPVEEREDRYLLTPSAAIGIKLRGEQGGLEVKHRSEAKARGAEKWKKTRLGKQGDAQVAALAVAEEHLREQAAEAGASGGGTAAAGGQACAGHWVSVQKRRQQDYTSGWPTQLVVEQTHLRLQLHQSTAAGGAPQGPAVEYLSFAVEGGGASALYEGVGHWLGVASKGGGGPEAKQAWRASASPPPPPPPPPAPLF